MRYHNVFPAIFCSRPNRFIAVTMREGKEEVVHVKNTGRCRELLMSGSKVYLTKSENPQRKTKFDLIAVEKKTKNGASILINMDSQAPNDVIAEWIRAGNLFSPNAVVRRETTFSRSRFDFYVEDGDERAYLEVKGVTLEEDGCALFPDAPTLRGVRHVEELIRVVQQGMKAYLIFVIQMNQVSSFSPNDETHKAFGDALRRAKKAGVELFALSCTVEPDALFIDKKIPIIL